MDMDNQPSKILLKDTDTIGNCQRPVFSLVVSQLGLGELIEYPVNGE